MIKEFIMTDTTKPNQATGFAALLGATSGAAEAAGAATVVETVEPAAAVTTGMTSSSNSILGTRVVAQTVKLPEAGYKTALQSRIGSVKAVATVSGVHYFDKADIEADEDAKVRAEALLTHGRLAKF